jgi:hypothetical protein
LDVKAAFELLGLPLSASAEEIDDRYRDLARDAHPDAGGSETRMRELNTARDLAKVSLAAGTAIVPASLIRDLILASQGAMGQQERREEARGLARRMTHRATSRLRRMKELSALLGALSAGALFLGKDLPTQVFSNLPAPITSHYGASFTLVAILFAIGGGIGYWMLQDRVRRVEQDIQDLEHHLGFRSSYVDFLLEVWAFAEHGPWSVADLEQGIELWARQPAKNHSSWQHLARMVGSSEFARLLITKGQGLGLLTRKEEAQGVRLREEYSLTVAPGEA